MAIYDRWNLISNEADDNYLLCDENLDFSNDQESSAVENSNELNGDNNSEFNGLEVSNVSVYDLFCDDFESEFKVPSDECIIELVKKESEFMVESGYVSRLKNKEDLVSGRTEAINWIAKVIAHFNFGPLCAYLAVSYMDRILSATDTPDQDWKMHLLAVVCLTVAAKIEEPVVPESLDLQVVDPKFRFDANTIMKWELGLLSTLKWKMQAITPFSFLDYFVHKINGDKYPLQSVMTRSIMVILSIIREIEFLEYRPSEIAAAVAIHVCEETPIVEVDKSFQLLIEYVQKDRVLECIKKIKESLKRRADESGSGSSPIDVLDLCFSFKSDESPDVSIPSSHESVGSKRKRLD